MWEKPEEVVMILVFHQVFLPILLTLLFLESAVMMFQKLKHYAVQALLERLFWPLTALKSAAIASAGVGYESAFKSALVDPPLRALSWKKSALVGPPL